MLTAISQEMDQTDAVGQDRGGHLVAAVNHQNVKVLTIEKDKSESQRIIHNSV